MEAGGYVFTSWLQMDAEKQYDTYVKFHWIRKAYQYVEGIDVPEAFVTSDHEVKDDYARYQRRLENHAVH